MGGCAARSSRCGDGWRCERGAWVAARHAAASVGTDGGVNAVHGRLRGMQQQVWRPGAGVDAIHCGCVTCTSRHEKVCGGVETGGGVETVPISFHGACMGVPMQSGGKPRTCRS
eukprot:54426-Chlamydomonas_euryale.AAC.1